MLDLHWPFGLTALARFAGATGANVESDATCNHPRLRVGKKPRSDERSVAHGVSHTSVRTCDTVDSIDNLAVLLIDNPPLHF